jgi:beta-lactam-binding protein with PASTA domain
MMERRKTFCNKHPYLSNILIAVLSILVLVVLTSIFLRVFTRHGQANTVPDFTGLNIAEAKQLADKHKLVLEITDSVNIATRPLGTVFRQIPPAEAKVKQGRRILLVINATQPRMIEMPNVVGYSLRQAKTVLVASGLHVGRLDYVEDMATNNVLGQRCGGRPVPPGTSLPADSQIELVVGKNYTSESTFVPLLTGYTAMEAKDRLAESSLNAGALRYDHTVRTYIDSLSARVYRQSPDISTSATLPLGYRVELWLTVDESKLAQ